MTVVLLVSCDRGCGDGEEAGSSTQPTPSEPAPPADVGPVVAAAGFRQVDVAEVGPAGVRVLFADDAGHGRLCEAGQPSRVGLPLGFVRCVDVDPAVVVDGTTRLVPGREAHAPALLVVPGRGLVEPGGRRWTSEPLAAFEADNGGVTVVPRVRRGEPIVRVRLEDASEVSRTPLPPLDLRAGPALAGGEPWAVAEVDGAARLVRIGEAAAAPAGPAIASAEGVRACRGVGGAIVVVSSDPDVDAGTRRVWVGFGGEDGAAVVEGAVALSAGDPVCREGEAVFTWTAPLIAGVDERPVGHELRCRPDGCAATSSPLAIAGDDPTITEFTGRALLAWTAADGTRLRLAPVARFEHADDLGVLEGTKGAPAWRSWVVRAGAAILLEGRPQGIVAHRVDSTGETSRVEATAW